MVLFNNVASVVPVEKNLCTLNYHEIQTTSKRQNESQHYHFEGLHN